MVSFRLAPPPRAIRLPKPLEPGTSLWTQRDWIRQGIIRDCAQERPV